MLRKLTQTVGRYEKGSLHDWPQSTWLQIASEVGKPLDKISESVPLDTLHARALGEQQQQSSAAPQLPQRRGSRVAAA